MASRNIQNFHLGWSGILSNTHYYMAERGKAAVFLKTFSVAQPHSLPTTSSQNDW